jgi:hypothetical protein
MTSSMPPGDEQLDAWMRTQLAMPPLSDDGFSRRVIRALPPRRAPHRYRRIVMVSVGGVSGAAVAAIKLLEAAVNAHGPTMTLSGTALMATCLTFATIAISLGLSFQSNARRWLDD